LINWLALRRTGRASAPNDVGTEQRERAWTADALHQRYLADVFAYVARRIPNRHEAEDVTAEVFAAAFVALPDRRGTQGPYPWLLGIARRKVTDSLRHWGRLAGRVGALTDDLPAASRDLPEVALPRNSASGTNSTRPLHCDASPVSSSTMEMIRAISCCTCASMLFIRALYLT